MHKLCSSGDKSQCAVQMKWNIEANAFPWSIPSSEYHPLLTYLQTPSYQSWVCKEVGGEQGEPPGRAECQHRRTNTAADTGWKCGPVNLHTKLTTWAGTVYSYQFIKFLSNYSTVLYIKLLRAILTLTNFMILGKLLMYKMSCHQYLRHTSTRDLST